MLKVSSIALNSWKSLSIVLLLVAACISTGGAAENPGKPKNDSGEIFCSGTIRYAIGDGSWLSRTQGTVPIVLPLKVETGETVGRVTIPSLGIIEGQKNSQFTLSRDKAGTVILNVSHGTILYSLRSEAGLLFVSPISRVETYIGCTSSTKAFKWTPGSSLLGEITVENESSFHIFNLNGEAVIRHEGKPVRNMAAGRALQVTHLNPQEPVPANDFKLSFMPLSDGGRLIFKDQIMPNNWNLVAQGPQPTTTNTWDLPAGATAADNIGGGAGGYRERDSDNDHSHHTNPDRPRPQTASPTALVLQ